MKNKEITIYELMGLIKNDKAPKMIMFENEVYTFNGRSYWKKKNYFFKDVSSYSDVDIPNLKIEILSEENDEWKDIEEMTLIPENISLTSVVLENRDVINQLIKNQKYLKGKLDKDE